MGIRRLTVAFAAITMISLTGCGKVAEKATEKASEKLAEQACKDGQSGEDCDVDISKDGVKVNTDDGSFSAGGNVDYPDGFPEYLRADGFEPMSAVATGDGSMNVTLVGDTPGSELIEKLQSQATDAGCTVDEETAAAGVGLTGLDCAEGTVVLLDVGEANSQQAVTVTITPNQ